MNEQERQAIGREVAAALRRTASQSADRALEDEAFLRQIAGKLNLPMDPALRREILIAAIPVTMEFRDAARRQERLNAARQSRLLVATILFLLLILGAGLRFSGITRQSLTMDEYWSVYLATGRGTGVFNLPAGIVIASPPATSFVAAPSWWKIWTNIGSATHPPVYFLVLRFWIDVFGDRDFSTRAMSAVFSLASILIFFDVARRSSGSTWHGLAAAAIFAGAAAQTDFSRQARSYTLLIFLCLLVCHSMLLIQLKGPSKARIFYLTSAALAAALTHYFSAGALLGLGAYALIQLRGRQRKAVLLAMLAALVLAIAVWGPMVRKSVGVHLALESYIKRGGVAPLEEGILILPRRLLFDDGLGRGLGVGDGYLTTIALAALVYFVPLLRMRRNPGLLLWWLWTVGMAASLLVFDVINNTYAINLPRYVLLASPGVYAIVAWPWPTRFGWLIPAGFAVAVWSAGFVHWQAGPQSNPEIRSCAGWIAARTAPGEPVILSKCGPFYDANFAYIGVAHYGGDWNRPVVLLDNPPSASLATALAHYPRVWLLTDMPANLLPGWKMTRVEGNDELALWLAQPP